MSFTNILEGARQYFQGLPSTNNNRDGTTSLPTSNQSQQQQQQQTQQVPTSQPSSQQPPPPQQSTPSQQPPPQQQQQYFPPPPPHSSSSTPSTDLRWSGSNSKTPSTPYPPYTQYNNIVPNSTSKQSYPNTLYNNTPQKNSNISSSSSSNFNFNHNYNHTPPTSTSNSTISKNMMVNNLQQYHKHQQIMSTPPSSSNPYMFHGNNSRINNPVYESTNHSSSKSSTSSSVPSLSSSHSTPNIHQQMRNSSNHHHESTRNSTTTTSINNTSGNLLNLDRQNYINRNNLINSRPLAPSSTHQQYPTISTMDRAFAQQYSNSSKLLQQQQQHHQQLSTSSSSTNNSTIRSNVDNNIPTHNYNTIPNNNSTRHSTSASTNVAPYTIPQQHNQQHYPTTSTRTSSSSSSSKLSMSQHQYSQQQLRAHLMNNGPQQHLSTATTTSSSTSSNKLLSSQQYNPKLHQYHPTSSTHTTSSNSYHQQYNSQAQQQTTTQTSNYPTMANPASWFAQMSQQQFRSPQQQVYQPSQQRSSSTQGSATANSAELMAKSHHMQAGDLSLGKPHPSVMQPHEHGARLLQPPKVPPPQRQRTGPRRDSPLDLSVRTIRRSADSTLDDEGPSSSRTPELARTPTQFPDSSAPTPPRLPTSGPSEQARQEISLPNLLRSSEPMLPSFRPSFRTGGHSGEIDKPRDSSLLSLEQKFGPRVSAPAETLAQAPLPSYQPPQHREPAPQHREPTPQLPGHVSQYHSHREHAMPHLAAHAMAHNMQYQRHPKPNNAAADKRVLSILRNSLEVRNAQQQKLLAASEGMSGTYRLQVPRAMDSASPQFLREARQQSEATQPPRGPPPMPTMSLPPNIHPTPHGQTQGSELDGLAAFLAARIRTKAELKQCGDTTQSLLATTPSAAVSGHKRRQGDAQCSCDGACTCPRPKCRCEGSCICGLQRAAPVASRKASDTRSSTETSVFDFPDSDPEMSTPASVGDLRRNRKPPSIDTPVACADGQHCPAPSTGPVAPPAPVIEVEEDPLWASVCDSFVNSLETRGAKTSRAGHNFVAAQKRKLAEKEEAEGTKIRKTEIEIEEDDDEEEEEIEIKQEPAQEVCKEEMKLIETCLKATSECEKLLEIVPPPVKPKVEINSDSDSISKKSGKKVEMESSSESESDSDSEESVSLAVRQQQLLALVSSSESTDTSSEDSDWSDDVGRAVVGRLQPRSTRNRGRGYNIRTRLRSNQPSPPVKTGKRPGRPRRKVKSPTPDESSRDKSESPRPITRRTRQRSPSPALRKTRRKSKSPIISNKKSKSPITTNKKTRSKSKSPVRSKSPITRNSRKKSKSPENKRNKSKSPITTRNTRKLSKSPPPTLQRQSRKTSPIVDQGFYPGWESELVKFKQSLRMPSNLISIHSRPNSDPPTPTKKRRGCTNSPMSVASDPGISGNLRTLAARKFLRDMDTSDSSNSTPVHKPKIRDVELSDSSCSLPGRPKRNIENSKTIKDRKELLTKLANKLKGRVGVRGRKKKVELTSEEIKMKEESEDEHPKVPLRRGLRKRRRSSRLSGTNERRLLRSAALQRSNRALLNSKRHLRRRDLRASVTHVVVPAKPGAKRGPKGKRKLRSSGFDYLRKKKKKKDMSDTKKPPGQQATRQIAGSIEEIANEVRSWVVNKGLGETILHRAARMCHNDMVAYCLESLNMNPSPRDNAGYTPLHEACVRGHLSTARLLLMYGAKVDSSAQGGIRPLHEAADCGHIELLRLLLSYGADPLLATYCGQTPVALASSPEARRLLEKHLADVQGKPATPWRVEPSWNMDVEERSHWTGFDVLAYAPSPSPCQSDDELCDFEEITTTPSANNGLSSMTFPATWWLPGETDCFMLLPEVCVKLGHTQDWIRKSLRGDLEVKEMTKCQFLESAHCVHLLAADWKPETVKFQNSNSVSLVKLDDNIRKLLVNSSSKNKNNR